uniref:TATA-box binding protein associated factor 4 n=1 Tax=Astyanax mexicanus TaxID=7994 RepID=W5K5W2_ASTMX
MAAGSELLDDVFFSAEVDETAVSAVVGSLESQLIGPGVGKLAGRLQTPGGQRRAAAGDNMPAGARLQSIGAGTPGHLKQGLGPAPTLNHTPVSGQRAAPTGAPIGAPTGATLNGSNMVMVVNSHDSAAFSNTSSSPAPVPPTPGAAVNNGPGCVLKAPPPPSGTVIQTSLMNTSTVISAQTPGLTTRPTVALVRPPMQTQVTVAPPNGAAVNAVHLPTTITVAQSHRVDSPKALQTVAQAPTTVVQPIRGPIMQTGGRTTVPGAVAAGAGAIRAIAPQVLAPRVPPPQQNQPSVHNIQLPPGMVLVRSESGQLLMIHQQTLAQMQAQTQGAMAPRPTTPTSTPPVHITSVQAPGTPLITRPVAPTTIIKQSSPVPAGVQPTTALQRPPILQETLENVKKCKNFLSTLIKLASSGKQSSETAANVKELVKNLLEGKLEAEDFTSRLYRELNSSPQPYLVPFLKRSLPALRQLTPDSVLFIQQSQLPLGPPPTATPPSPALTSAVLTTSITSTTSSTLTTPTTSAHQPIASLPQHTHSKPNLVTFSNSYRYTLQQGAISPTPSVNTCNHACLLVLCVIICRDDDDINDVASMAGVNLSEESDRILATNSELVGAVTRSCKDEAFLYTGALHSRILQIGKKFGISELGSDVVSIVSHAAQQRLQNLLEKVTQVAQQRNVPYKEDERHEQVSDVRAQLKFFEQLDQMEKQRKEEQEREILMKAAKSRSRQEDPEQLRLKQKAKEMQQQELAQMRQRDANLTALAAIGPRKKRKVDSPASGSGPEVLKGCVLLVLVGCARWGSGGSRQFSRQRITRVNLRDLLFCLENERDTSRSHLLYKAFLK